MYNRKHYWLRVLMVAIVSFFANIYADTLLHVQIGSGRDWLICLAIMGTLFYFFVYKWMTKEIAKAR